MPNIPLMRKTQPARTRPLRAAAAAHQNQASSQAAHQPDEIRRLPAPAPLPGHSPTDLEMRGNEAAEALNQAEYDYGGYLPAPVRGLVVGSVNSAVRGLSSGLVDPAAHPPRHTADEGPWADPVRPRRRTLASYAHHRKRA